MRPHGPHTQPSRRQLLAGIATAGIVGTAGCATQSQPATDTITRTFDSTDLSTVVVESPDGAIDVTDSETPTVRVEGHKQAPDESTLGDITVDTARQQNRLYLATKQPTSGLQLLSSSPPHMDLTVALPDEVAVEAASTNGPITGEVVTTRHIQATTTNGPIDLTLASTADIIAKTTNGGVTLTLPATAEPTIDFRTTNGTIEITGLDTERISTNSDLTTTVGAGTHDISITTTNGDVTIRGEP